MKIAGSVILILEDEPVIGMALEDLLVDQGAETVYASTLAQGEDHAETNRLDAAILDVNIHGHDCYELARTLGEKGVSVIFATGYDATMHPHDLAEVPVIRKPYGMAEVIQAFDKL